MPLPTEAPKMKPALTIRIETDPVAASAGVSNAPLASAAPEERIRDRRVMAFIFGGPLWRT